MSTIAADPIASESPERQPVRVRKPLLTRALQALASLRLTVALFALSIGLVFFGTLAQKTAGIWTVVDQYFWSWVVQVELQPLIEFGKIFLGMPKDWSVGSWAAFPFPGGKLIGGLMFVNLLAAHALRFRLHWKQTGIWIAHSGIALMFIGEAITREFQVEQRMAIPEGGSVNFTEDHRASELAFVATAADGTQTVSVIPQSILRHAAQTGERITHPDLPADVRIDRYMLNSKLVDPKKAEPPLPNPATAGYGTEIVVTEQPEVSGVDPNQNIDIPSAYVTLFEKGSEKPAGTYLTTFWYTYDPFDRESEPHQSVTLDGTKYDLALRPKRYYKPFSLYLEDFRFDRYVGTTQAMNYSSDLVLIDPERGQERHVHVAMNEPLRYRGETFFQSDFDKRTETTTILQVVRNPGWVLPYVACTMVSVGLLFHFILHLSQYLSRQQRTAGATGIMAGASESWAARFLPWGLAVLVGGLFLAGQAAPRSSPGKLDLRSTARLPVVDGGRIKPLDTVARVFLRKISGREELVTDDGTTYPAIKWLLDAMSTPTDMKTGPAWKHKVVRIDNDQVKDLLGLKPREGSRYSLEEIAPRISELQAAVDKARPRPGANSAPVTEASADKLNKLFESGDRDVFAAQVLETAERIELYTRLVQRGVPLTLPPVDGREWRTYGDVERDAQSQAFFAALRNHGLTLDSVRQLPRNELVKLSEILEGEAEKLRLDRIAADPHAMKFLEVMSAYRAGEPKPFTDAVNAFVEATTDGTTPAQRAKARFEVFVNEFAPAYQVLKLYALAFLITLIGWAVMAFRPPLADALRRGAFWLLVVTFLAHTFALVSRMYLTDRWLVFVTNLYTSAVFIGWAAVGVCLFLERVFPFGLANAVGAVIGGVTGIIAHNLAASGDTLEMMQAVLDTNFWLATHVTSVTLGYSATYVAGAVAATYVLLGVFTPLLRQKPTVVVNGVPVAVRQDLGKTLGQIVYGVVCLATLLSFVGTVLGGIWADQSWGRFWGWDPKENGAVLIVIWNALILHARWAGLVKDRGVAVLALVGNMITTWSWFGTNQLGVGLHAYGFSNQLALGCTITWLLHLGLIATGLIPTRLWQSFAPPIHTREARP